MREKNKAEKTPQKIKYFLWMVSIMLPLLSISTFSTLAQAKHGFAQEATPQVTPEVTPESDSTELADPQGEISSEIDHTLEEGANSCYECHVELDEKQAAVSEIWLNSVHGDAGITCADCHGGNSESDEMKASMSPDQGFIGIPARKDTPELCGNCHSDPDRMRQYNLSTDQYSKYLTSVHGSRLKTGDYSVAICVDCHGHHDVKKASDPSAAVYVLNIPELCASCHSDAELMESYDIPSNQYQEYQSSVHGEALIGNQDMRAPSCVSCHGSHGAKPPLDEEVINVCGKCHTATQEFYEQSLHSRIGEAAPKCVTCHGTHDMEKPGEDLFLHTEQQDQTCTTCHLNEDQFNMDQTRFAAPEDRRCDTCHHPESWIMTQVKALWTALSTADQQYKEAERSISEAASRGMIVNEAEVKLAEAHTSLTMARATLHTTKLTLVTDLTDTAVEEAEEALSIADQKLDENIFRRQAMVIVIAIIFVNILTLRYVKKNLNKSKD
jgi:predicted CXXCH cytochrome family protein